MSVEVAAEQLDLRSFEVAVSSWSIASIESTLRLPQASRSHACRASRKARRVTEDRQHRGGAPKSAGQNLMIASRMESFVHLPRSISWPLKWVMVVPLTSCATNGDEFLR